MSAEAHPGTRQQPPARGPVRGSSLTALLPDGKPGRTPHAEILLAILQDNYEVVRTREGEPLVTANSSPSVSLPLRGKRGLRQRLSGDMFTLTGRSPSQESLATTLNTVEGLAGQLSGARELRTRTGLLDGCALLDLGRDDGLTAWIMPGRWDVSLRVPVLWKRGAMIGELPVPAPQRAAERMPAQFLFNFRERGQWVTAVACQVAGILYPQSTHPVELYSADSSGALKTATLRAMKNWTDPGPTVPVPKNNKSWAVVASSSYRIAVDNVSAIPAWWSDLLCKAASGDDWADRALYTDDDVAASSFYAVPMLNGIGLVALRDDLSERAVRHHLTRPRWFLGDDEVEAAWNREHPVLLSWLLDTCAEVARLHWHGMVQRPRTGRMEVFKWVIAALDALWNSGGEGMRWYKGSLAEAAADAVRADQMATAITEAVKEAWQGYAAELYERVKGLMPYADEYGQPWNFQKFGQRLPRAASAVTKLGWTMRRTDPDPHSKQRMWVIAPPG
jgi:hypothetical protein